MKGPPQDTGRALFIFPEGKVKLRVGKMEMTGAGKLGGHIEWIGSNEIGNSMASLDASAMPTSMSDSSAFFL